ncbi:MAG: MerR family transcriptional regulator [Pseudonocardiales bacterium]|nr:MAG: MerR family transcriptional regulator [Pseudonocardiales bacterium]
MILSIRDAAQLLGVSDDTVRRWGEAGRLELTETVSGRHGVEGRELAQFAVAQAREPAQSDAGQVSARNRFTGIVTEVVRDTVMAQVEMQCGPHRVVSLMSREAADDLGLEPGVLAVASIKSTSVVIEHPDRLIGGPS